MSSRVHDALLVFHRWVALITTVFILLVAITGSALVFEGAIDRGLNPRLWDVTPGPTTVSLDTLVARAVQAAGKGRVTGLTLSPLADRAHVAQVGPLQVFLDPYTGRVLGTRDVAVFQRTLPRRLHVLHTSLLAGKLGGEIVGIATIAAFLLTLSGIVLWWPDRLWRVRWSASWKRVVFDLHHAAGIAAALVVLMIAGTGLVIHYEALNRAMYSLDREPEPDPIDQSTPPAGTPSISVDSSYHVATRALPGARVMFLTLPPKPDQPYVVAMRFPEDHTPGGRSRVMVDRYTGQTLLVTSTRQAQLGTRLGNALRSAHTGDLFGKTTEVIWLLAAIVLAGQAVTGVLMWWNGRRARAAKRGGQQRRAQPIARSTAAVASSAASRVRATS